MEPRHTSLGDDYAYIYVTVPIWCKIVINLPVVYIDPNLCYP